MYVNCSTAAAQRESGPTGAEVSAHNLRRSWTLTAKNRRVRSQQTCEVQLVPTSATEEQPNSITLDQTIPQHHLPIQGPFCMKLVPETTHVLRRTRLPVTDEAREGDRSNPIRVQVEDRGAHLKAKSVELVMSGPPGEPVCALRASFGMRFSRRVTPQQTPKVEHGGICLKYI